MRWEEMIKRGEIDAARWTFLALKHFTQHIGRDIQNIRWFAELARERVPAIQFPAQPARNWENEMDLAWSSLQDVYAFADRWLGGLFSFSHFFESLVVEHDPVKRDDIVADMANTVLGQRGRPRKDVDKGSGRTFVKRGNNRAYVLARLERDYPADYERAASGAWRAVAIEHGILKPDRRIRLSETPAEALKLIVARFGANYLNSLLMEAFMNNVTDFRQFLFENGGIRMPNDGESPEEYARYLKKFAPPDYVAALAVELEKFLTTGP
jgi:hypothetical protein